MEPLMVQWLGLPASNAGGIGSILVRELRSYMLCKVGKKVFNFLKKRPYRKYATL